MANKTTAEVVRDWNRALEARDFDAARALLADDLRFDGPIDHFERAEDYVAAIKRLYGMVKGVRQLGKVAQGDQVALFTVLETAVADAPVAEWYTVRGGKITNLRAYFDARPFAPPSSSR